MVEEMPKYKSCRIEGYTCPLGESGYNIALSHRRAESVVSYLRAAGIHTGFQVIAYGEERLATSDPDQYALNRRVVVECEK
jgi:outer membrane protein OmpA-like peptidoglycan-associated protein